MNNEAIVAILDHLCNEARNSMHATLGVMDLLRDIVTEPAQRASVAVGRASADQLLCSIDDVRELLASPAPAPAAIEEFDLAMCTGEIIEVLNLASAKRRVHMILDQPDAPVMLKQDRRIVEQVLTRVLSTAFKLSQVSDVHVQLKPGCNDEGVWVRIHARDESLARRLAMWLKSNPGQAVFKHLNDVAYEVAVMVAGKRLHGLGGSVELEQDAAGHCVVALDFPMGSEGIGNTAESASPAHAHPGALNVLVAEDCDDSFALTELMLQDESVRRARDGEEALDLIQRSRFDVVLMDIHMPGMDGYESIRNMRDWETRTGNARTPIVVLSSDDLETQRQRAARCGCSGFLRKPLRRSELTNLLDRLKQSRSLIA
jgi:CheY-like chemotaxis protein